MPILTPMPPHHSVTLLARASLPIFCLDKLVYCVILEHKIFISQASIPPQHLIPKCYIWIWWVALRVPAQQGVALGF